MTRRSLYPTVTDVYKRQETLLAKYFDGPVMFVAAAEETQDNLVGGRGDAYCGVLNASYFQNILLTGFLATTWSYNPTYAVT